MNCPCNSKLLYTQCCEIIHTQHKEAKLPSELMRARYSAYALKHYQFIYNTLIPSKRGNNELSDIQSFADSVKFIALQVLDVHDEKQSDKTAHVTFKAWYQTSDNTYHWIKEKSEFNKDEGLWYYVTGDVETNEKPIKLNRNDLCLCQSGKKYKKCCQHKS